MIDIFQAPFFFLLTFLYPLKHLRIHRGLPRCHLIYLFWGRSKLWSVRHVACLWTCWLYLLSRLLKWDHLKHSPRCPNLCHSWTQLHAYLIAVCFPLLLLCRVFFLFLDLYLGLVHSMSAQHDGFSFYTLQSVPFHYDLMRSCCSPCSWCQVNSKQELLVY